MLQILCRLWRNWLTKSKLKFGKFTQDSSVFRKECGKFLWRVFQEYVSTWTSGNHHFLSNSLMASLRIFASHLSRRIFERSCDLSPWWLIIAGTLWKVMFLSLSERFPRLKTQQNFPMAYKVVVCLTSACHPTWRPSYGCYASHVMVQNLYSRMGVKSFVLCVTRNRGQCGA